VKFCQAIDDTEDYLAMTRKDPNPWFKQKAPPMNVYGQQTSIEEVERKIKAQIVMKQIRLKEFVYDFDGLRKGTVSEPQFCRLLALATVSLSPAEYRCLLGKYQLENSLVKYREFIDEMDLIFTEKAIDKDPLFQVQ